MSTPRQISETYFAAWEAGDFDTLGTLLAQDVDFVGVLGQTSGVEETLAGLKGLGQVLTRIEVRARVADDSDVITWFDLHTSVAGPTGVANWTHVEDGKIKHIRVTFDPREFIAGLNQAQEDRCRRGEPASGGATGTARSRNRTNDSSERTAIR